ncbi:MAG TPA: hypothetical protein VGB64_03300 [Actinomycetota bacterium]
MTGAPEDFSRALLIAGAVLFLGARFAVRIAMPPSRGRHRRKPGSPRPPRPARPARERRPAIRPDPVPVAGGATGLLESIPYLEPVRRHVRLRGAARLALGIAAAALLAAGLMFLLASRLPAWLDSAGI